MGCGASSATGIMAKDPEDLFRDHMRFEVMRIHEFDSFLNEEVAPTVNKVVDIVNKLNGTIDGIKEAATPICGGYKVKATFDGKDHDTVVLAIQKADGTYPTADDVKKLAEDDKIVKAQAAVLKALDALHADQEGGAAKLTLAEGALAGSPKADELNAAIKALADALGAGYKVNKVLKSATTPGATCMKAVIQKPDSSNAVDMLDIAKAKTAAGIFVGQQALAASNAALTKAVKAAEAAKVTVTLEFKNGKLYATQSAEDTKLPDAPPAEGGEEGAEKPEGEEGEKKKDEKKKAPPSTADQREAVVKAVEGVNSAVFKLTKAARNATADVTLAHALKEVFEAMKTKLKSLGKDPMGLIKVAPNVKANLDGVDFDLGLKVNLPEYENLDAKECLDKLLPAPAKAVTDKLLGIKDVVMELIPEFKDLAEKVKSLVEKAPEVFKDPTDKIKKVIGDDFMAIGKIGMAVARNVKTVVVEPVLVVKAFSDTLGRLSDELGAAVTELKAMFP